ncbi:SCP2 domain-containing protein [Thalassomonas sp. M1454]|uniref:ubiquinone anaerobic biosynthesis accessory factor UbiT n=1 Tax=Thalassomonas sp. M1454 TaxID=2594477 RepID=UPI00117EEE8B|nr:SCP2 sterol-binding domain-containing protein [Thalassomonas sp. M1454]TRX56890.1 SCP2 domain-containing protein [Thalassomonas sp. M1454]
MLLPKIVCEILPRFAHLSSQIVPNKIQSKAIEFAINNVLKESLEDGELDFLEEQILEIKVTDLNKSWFFTVIDERIIVKSEQSISQVTISGEFNSFALLASQTIDPDTLFFRRKLLIEGDVDLGLAVKNLLDRVELEQLPNLLSKPIEMYATRLNQTA